jgi:hypothetical protein
MKEIIVGSEGFGSWGTVIINRLIEMLYPDIKITWNNSDKANIVVRSFNTRQEKYWNKNKKPYIYWSGEPSKNKKYSVKPNRNSCKKFLNIGTHFLRHNEANYIYTPYFLYSPYLFKERINLDVKKKYLVGYCASNKVSKREKIYNKFVNQCGVTSSVAFGKCYGEFEKTKKKIKGRWKSKALIDNYSQCKFVLAMENSDEPGYITEKIYNAFYSGAIPIYWGTNKITEFFNKKAFINVKDFKKINHCIKYVKNMSDEKRQQMLSEPILRTDNEIINMFKNNENNKTCQIYLSKMREFLMSC